MASIDDLFEAAKNVAYASVGSLDLGIHSAKDVFEDLADRGRSVVDKSKDQSDELLEHAKQKGQEGLDAALRSFLKLMSKEERKLWLSRAQAIVEELDLENEVVEAEVVEDTTEDSEDADA